MFYFILCTFFNTQNSIKESVVRVYRRIQINENNFYHSSHRLQTEISLTSTMYFYVSTKFEWVNHLFIIYATYHSHEL